jgi:hypothetical protein
MEWFMPISNVPTNCPTCNTELEARSQKSKAKIKNISLLLTHLIHIAKRVIPSI